MERMLAKNRLQMKMSKPIVVLLSDVHYDLGTLALADAATRQAIAKANELRVPLIVAGDLHNTKANLRGECVNAMRKTFKLCNSPPYFIVGNHDKIHEKSKEHSLSFLEDFGPIITKPVHQHRLGYLVPYYSDSNDLREYLKTLPKNSQLIMHQGIEGSNSGDYIQDKSAITKQDVAGFRVISGHYHSRQTIVLPGNGVWNYIGNPYTLNFGETRDPEKGFQILMSDGSLEFVPTNLRKHVLLEVNVTKEQIVEHDAFKVNTGDVVRVKLKGSKEVLASWTKQKLSEVLELNVPYSLEVIAEGNIKSINKSGLTKVELLDSLIDSINSSNDSKARLKQSWRDLID